MRLYSLASRSSEARCRLFLQKRRGRGVCIQLFSIAGNETDVVELHISLFFTEGTSNSSVGLWRVNAHRSTVPDTTRQFRRPCLKFCALMLHTAPFRCARTARGLHTTRVFCFQHSALSITVRTPETRHTRWEPRNLRYIIATSIFP